MREDKVTRCPTCGQVIDRETVEEQHTVHDGVRRTVRRSVHRTCPCWCQIEARSAEVPARPPRDAWRDLLPRRTPGRAPAWLLRLEAAAVVAIALMMAWAIWRG